jgi:cobyrinic acid a,c-diamide synthase
MSDEDQVLDFQQKIQQMCVTMVAKIEEKNQGLILNHQHFGLYETTLLEKYRPVFDQMRQLIQQKRLQYTLFLKKQLSKNAERIETEKAAVQKFRHSIGLLQDRFKQELE